MPSPPPGTMGVTKRPGSKKGNTDVVGQNDAEENEQEHEASQAGSGSTTEGATQPRKDAAETVSVNTPPPEQIYGAIWSADTGDFEDCLCACFCPCIVIGRNLQLLDIDVSFVKGCAPVGLLIALTLIFFSLPYWTDNGPCSFPSAMFEWQVTAAFFGGDCTPTEYVSIPFTRISWFCFAFSLNYVRRRIADELGIQESYCPSLFFQCCCCYACLLTTEQRTVRDIVEKRGPSAQATVGEPTAVQTI